MNIIVINNGYNSYDNRTRIDFIKKLSNFKDVKLYCLKTIDCKQLEKSMIKPDILFFIMHEPTIRTNWPNELFELSIPTVILEEDHYESKFDGLVYADKMVLNWYKEKKISLLLRRHCYNEKAPVESVWLPFSANEEEYYNIYIDTQESKIGFAGSHQSTQIYYDVRRLAIQKLIESNLLDSHYGKIYNGYIKYLMSHIGCLACTGGILHTCLAKTFEIPLSGSALLTNHMDHSKLLWGDNQCFFEYKDDCSNIVELAKLILTNNKDVQEVRKNGLYRVLKYHTDYHRIVELYEILKALVEGKNIPRKWNQ